MGGDGYGIATPLSTSGRFIVDAHNRRVRLAGLARTAPS